MSNKRRRPKIERIRADELAPSLHVNPVFMEGMLAYQENPDAYEIRAVMARKIRIPDEYTPTPEGLAIMRADFTDRRARYESPTAPPIMVIETADGRLWTYDDVHVIAVYHEMAPTAMLRVVILGKDETPVPNA